MRSAGEGTWSSLSSGKKAALILGLPVGATVGYILYRFFISRGDKKDIIEESRVTIPLEVYRNIARHQGSFLDLVSQESGAQVKLLAENGDKCVCFQLRGSTEQVLLARCSLDKLASDCEAITDVFEVPQTALGRIIGRGGESLKQINRTSGARVSCPKDKDNSLAEKGTVSITGTRREVQLAKELVMEKVMESEEVRHWISQSSALRPKRRPSELQGQKNDRWELNNKELQFSQEKAESQTTVQATRTTVTPDRPRNTVEGQINSKTKTEEGDTEEMFPQSISKFEIPSPDLSFQPGEHFEVYVCASENPQHFWIQILGVRSLQLDKLTAEMGRFYSNGNRAEQKVDRVVIGDIVAVPFLDHGTWNRARVLGVLESGLVDLYYVDYGDIGSLPLESLRTMRSDFLSLPFQAIECSLAGVTPAGELWTEKALDDFEHLTYCAQWKPLLAKLCSYSHSGISSWPSVQLYDNSHGKVLDVAEELVHRGHAVRCVDLATEGGLRGTRDDPGSLQKMLDDVTGVTSELSLSCISLSGYKDPCCSWVRNQSASCLIKLKQFETIQADVDQGSGVLITNSSVSHLDSLTSQVGMTGTCMHPVCDHGHPVQECNDDGMCLHSKDSLDPCQQLESPGVFSRSSTTSSSGAEVMSLAQNSLSEEVFLSGTTSTADGCGTSFISTEGASACSSVFSDSGGDGSSSGEIRGVWYYLSSMSDSSPPSRSPTPPFTSPFQTDCESSEYSFFSGPSLDLSESLQESEDTGQELLRFTVFLGQEDTEDHVAKPVVLSVSPSSADSSNSSANRPPCVVANEIKALPESISSFERVESSGQCWRIEKPEKNKTRKGLDLASEGNLNMECELHQVQMKDKNTKEGATVLPVELKEQDSYDITEHKKSSTLHGGHSVMSQGCCHQPRCQTFAGGNANICSVINQGEGDETRVTAKLCTNDVSSTVCVILHDIRKPGLVSEVASISGSMDDVIEVDELI